jgi:hypothetical protein
MSVGRDGFLGSLLLGVQLLSLLCVIKVFCVGYVSWHI